MSHSIAVRGDRRRPGRHELLEQFVRGVRGSPADPVALAEPGRAAASARRRAGRGLGGLERRTAAIHEALEIIDSVLHCRHADFAECPNYRKVISDRIGVPTPSS
jgi:hypothetical protein